MRLAALTARILLGLAFTIFGIDYWLHFLPSFGDPSPEGLTYLEALFATGYMFPVIKMIEAGSGLLLLSGFLVPLALALLAPIVFNILLYHLFLDPTGRWLAVTLFALELYLLWVHRDAFRPLFRLRSPRATAGTAVPAVSGAALEGQGGRL